MAAGSSLERPVAVLQESRGVRVAVDRPSSLRAYDQWTLPRGNGS